MIFSCTTASLNKAAQAAKKAHHEGTSLKEAVLNMNLMTAAEFDARVKPEEMVHPRSLA